jgi:hypothetical protein
MRSGGCLLSLRHWLRYNALLLLLLLLLSSGIPRPPSPHVGLCFLLCCQLGLEYPRAPLFFANVI